MIIRARAVVTMDGPPIENGAVVVGGSRIVDVGSFNEVRAHNSGEVFDLGEQALLPGLISAHCHLDYTCLRGKIPRPKSFAEWIRAINAEKAKLLPEDYLASINQGFAEAKRFGTTTIANLEASPELIPEINEPIRTWWLAELIDVRQPDRAKEFVDLAVESLKSKKHWGLAPHALFTASANLYRCCEDIACGEKILLTTHLAESDQEMSMFRDASGPLYEFMKAIGRDMKDCGHKTPVELFVGVTGSEPDWHRRALPAEWIITHMNELSESDFDLLTRAASAKATTAARSTAKFSIVHCPRSHKYFGHSPFQFGKLRKLGLNICLGTDSLASNEDLSLFAEMRAFQKSFPDISPQEILSMVTSNPARALRQENSLGKIRRGTHADLLTVPCTSSTTVFEEIIACDGSVDWVMLGGKRM
jgi:cytosine/adenosine deaminase-related metal-dependent hydrolase